MDSEYLASSLAVRKIDHSFVTLGSKPLEGVLNKMNTYTEFSASSSETLHKMPCFKVAQFGRNLAIANQI